ncbi:MAG: hypothetical protein IJW84_00895 [Alphaproteobacteria bacterium]|nr:hypothetical protein [Alphaproteobacteria bacterium]
MAGGSQTGEAASQACNLAMYYPEEAKYSFCGYDSNNFSSLCSTVSWTGASHPAVVYLNEAGTYNYPVIVCFNDSAFTNNDVSAEDLCYHMIDRNLRDKVPLQIGSYSTGNTYPYTINNHEFFICELAERCWDSGWEYYSTGVEVEYSGRTCQANGSCGGGTTAYRCASGYYGYSSSGVPTCTSCATTGFSNATSIAGDNSNITKCYLPVASYMDTVGTFDITGTYCNYSLDGYDHIVPPVCSERVAKGCSLPSVGHECYAAYSRASSGDLVCIDCSALDKDGLKMINTCYKD